MLQSAPAAVGRSAAVVETGWRHLVIPTNATEFWAAALVTVGVLGLLSIWFLRKDVKTRTTREAAQTTIDRCEDMALVLIPAFIEILNEASAKKVASFVKSPADVSFDAAEEAKKTNAAIAWLGTVPAPTRDKVIALMNRLEVWSMSFTHDPALADQSVAYKPCSAAFCQMVMWLYPMLLTQRRLLAPGDSGPFHNTVTLFNGWYKKQAKDQLMEQLLRLESGGSLPKPIS